MSNIRIDANAVSGVWARGLDSAAPSAGGRQGQAFGDFSAFSRQEGRLSLSASAHRDIDGAARAVSDHLTDTRDNGFA